MPLPIIAEASNWKAEGLPQPATNVGSQLEGLRTELQQLHDSLGRLDTQKINPVSTVLFQFIAVRLSEIAAKLSELAAKSSNP